MINTNAKWILYFQWEIEKVIYKGLDILPLLSVSVKCLSPKANVFDSFMLPVSALLTRTSWPSLTELHFALGLLSSLPGSCGFPSSPYLSPKEHSATDEDLQLERFKGMKSGGTEDIPWGSFRLVTIFSWNSCEDTEDAEEEFWWFCDDELNSVSPSAIAVFTTRIQLTAHTTPSTKTLV